jgi:hypothetical protein
MRPASPPPAALYRSQPLASRWEDADASEIVHRALGDHDAVSSELNHLRIAGRLLLRDG